MTPGLYYDLGSSYAYLAFERAESVLGVAPEPRPVLLGALFGMRGWPSWGEGPHRAENVAECERRAIAYGLPPFAWPAGWPGNMLAAMRAATWAGTQGAATSFPRAAFGRAFAGGENLGDPAVLAAVAADAGLDPAAMAGAIADPAVKGALRDATDAAFAAGVRGVPTIAVGETLFYGDDTLEQAAAAL